MEARLRRIVLVLAVLFFSAGASYRTPNFVIETTTPRQAEEFGKTAERLRRELALAWLGKEMPRWAEPCRVTAQVGPNLGAGGATTFLFDHGEVFGWRMTIQGSHARILDSVLPHEITHMILASYFRRPLPRWADEGAATTVEHTSERQRHRRMLVRFLHTQRGIAFNRMFAMTEYPKDVMPLYAQGFSLCDFLIQQGGRRKFLAYLDEGMKGDRWSEATEHRYGYANLGALQDAWVGWVAKGFPVVGRPDAAAPETLAAARRLPRPEPNLIYRGESEERAVRPASYVEEESPPGSGDSTTRTGRTNPPPGQTGAKTLLAGSAWHPSGQLASPAGGGTRPPAASPSGASSPPVSTEVSHPQPIQGPGQVILEWRR